MTESPYKPPAEVSNATPAWTSEGTLVASRDTKQVTLPRICYATGKTHDLVTREIPLVYFVCGNWIVPVTVLSILGFATALTAPKNLDPSVEVPAISGLLLYGLIAYFCHRKIIVTAYESFGLASVRRRKLSRFAIAMTAIGIPMTIVGQRTVELPLPLIPVIGIALAGWYSQRLQRLSARPVSGGLFQIRGFSDQFHVERERTNPLGSASSPETS